MRLTIISLILLLFANSIALPQGFTFGRLVDTNDPSTMDLYAWYPFMHGTGNMIAELCNVSFSAMAIMYNFNYTATSGWVLDDRGVSLKFDGGDDYVNTKFYGGRINQTSGYRSGGRMFNDGHTFACWIKPTDGNPGTAEMIFGSTDTTTNYQHLASIQTDGDICWFIETNTIASQAYTINQPLADGQEDWHHIVFTVNAADQDPGGMKIYFDGEKQILAAAPLDGDLIGANLSLFNINRTMLLGKRNVGSGTYPYDGRMSDVRFYKRVFTDWEVSKLYRDSYNQKYPVRKNPAYLLQSVYAYDFDDYVAVAVNTVAETSEIDVSSAYYGSISIASSITTIGSMEGLQIIVQASSAGSGDEDWTNLRTIYYPGTAPVNTNRNGQSLSGPEAIGQTTLEIGNTTGYYDNDGTRWIFVEDNTATNSEICYLVSHVAGTSVDILDGTTKAHDNHDDLSDFAETHAIYIPSVYDRIRLIWDNTNDAGGAEVHVRAEFVGIEEDVSVVSGQIIRLVR